VVECDFLVNHLSSIICSIDLAIFKSKRSNVMGQALDVQDEPQITDSAIRNTKLLSLFGMIFLSIILMILFFV
jgi:hypothetical protein